MHLDRAGRGERNGFTRSRNTMNTAGLARAWALTDDIGPVSRGTGSLMEKAGSRSLILIADDDPECLQMLFNTLSGVGDVEIAVASDGEMLLELVGRSLPDLILLD